jgi:hypothetical protein
MQRSVLLRVTSRRSCDSSYCSIHRLQCLLATGSAGRSDRRGGEGRRGENIAHCCCAIAFRGFCASTAPAWGEYATVWIYIPIICGICRSKFDIYRGTLTSSSAGTDKVLHSVILMRLMSKILFIMLKGGTVYDTISRN